MCLCKDERNEEEKKSEETDLFTKYYTEWRGGVETEESYKTIPRFYYKVAFNICNWQYFGTIK